MATSNVNVDKTEGESKSSGDETNHSRPSDTVVSIEANGETDMQILDCLIETSLLTLGAVPNIRNLNFEATKAKFRKVFPWEKDFEIKQAGSTVDMLYLTKFWLNSGNGKEDVCKGIDFNTDIDVLFIPTSVHVSNEESRNPETIAYIEETDFPSFVKLKYNIDGYRKLPEVILTECKDGKDFYISSQKFLAVMKGYMNVQQEVSEIAGPSLQIQPHAMHTPRSFLTSADIVFAFKNPEWPTLASEWLTRERPNKWPPANIIEEVQALGSHVVAKGNQLSPEFEVTWRLSFNMAERNLAELMTSTQRKCFLTLKTLVKETKISAISSYHLKTVLWWMLEQGDFSIWVDHSVGHCFLAYVHEVLKVLHTGVIKNYFISECNMIQTVDKKMIHQLILKLQDIGEKPLSSIIRSPALTENSVEIFSICPVEEYHFKHVKEAILQYDGDEQKKKTLLRFFKFHFLNLGTCFVVDPNQREKGITLLMKVAELLDPNFNKVDFVKQELLDATKSALSQNNLEAGLSFFGALLTVIPNEEAVEVLKAEGNGTEMLASLFHDTGCVFLNWSNIGYWKHQRENDMQASEKCFKTSVSLKPVGQENHAEYAHFLFVAKRYEEALKYADITIANSKGASEYSCLCYSVDDSDVLETSIARHVQYEQGIVVPAVVVAYHVIVLANKNLDKVDKAKDVLVSYKEACLDGRHSQKYETLSVYGYSCMALGMYQNAKEAFLRADEIKHTKLQEDNMDICNKSIAATRKN